MAEVVGVAVVFTASVVYGQTPTASPAPPLKTTKKDSEVTALGVARKVTEFVDLYGRAAAHLGAGHDTGLRNNGSRFGIRADVPIWGPITARARLEWAIKVGEGDEKLNLSTSSGQDFGTLEITQTTPALVTRLGTVGLDFNQYGNLYLGKQWGVYYDVTQYTDIFDVYGAYASSTYTGGTDGGDTGTGRANDALSYRWAYKGLALGAQAQFEPKGKAVDSLAGVARYTTPCGLTGGVAYNHAFLDDDLAGKLEGYDGDDSRALAAVLSFQNEQWRFSAVYARSWNHEIVFPTDNSGGVVFSGDGVEVAATWTWRKRLRLALGYNGLFPRNLTSSRVAEGYQKHNGIVGLRIYLAEWVWAYAELNAPLAPDVSGQLTKGSGALGLFLDFSLRRVFEKKSPG